jgi:hypothetical protein
MAQPVQPVTFESMPMSCPTCKMRNHDQPGSRPSTHEVHQQQK